MKASASQDEILKAFRKRSRLLHPDKAKQSFIASKATASPKRKGNQKIKKPSVHVNKGPSENEIQAAVKIASDRYARLGVIAEILQGSGRERYDFFLRNGFPKWRGTGYYYARFRPGLGSVLVGLFIFGGGLSHYAAMYISWQRQKEFAERYVRNARKSAWGDESGIGGVPGVEDAIKGISAPGPSSFAQENGAAVLNRRQKREQEKQAKKDERNPKKSKIQRTDEMSTSVDTEPSNRPRGVRKRVQAENGKMLVVDSFGNVFIEEEDQDGKREEFFLDPNALEKPTFKDTILYQLPIWSYNMISSRLTSATAAEEQDFLTEDNMNMGNTLDETVEQGASSARKRSKRAGKT